MVEIFINYRRSDSLGYTGRLADHLRNCFGVERVFRDAETLETGVRFKQEIQDTILSSCIVLVIIGPEWAVIDAKTGRRRLENEDDFVRFEIEYALIHRIPVIPVLVGGAQMPTSDMLPRTIKQLTEFNAHHLTETHWAADAGRLVNVLAGKTGLDVIDQSTQPPSSPQWLKGLRQLFYFAPNFLALLSQPKQFLRKQCFGRPKDLLYALIFFIMLVLIAETYLANTWLPEQQSFWGFVFLGLPFWLLITFLISVPMWLSWWLVGARDHYQRTVVVLLYQMAVVILLAYLGSVMMITGLLFRDPDLIQIGMQILKDSNVKDKYERVSEITAAAMVGPLAFIASGLGFAVLCTIPLWLISSWGGYREVLHRPHWASWLSFPIFAVLMGGPLLFLLWLE